MSEIAAHDVHTACLGVHLAYLEMSLGVAKFLRECPTTVIKSKDEGMEFENYFLIAPKAHKCEIPM